MDYENMIISRDELILVTGANGFIGKCVTEALLSYGFNNLRCFVRPSGEIAKLKEVIGRFSNNKAELVYGNLISPDDCRNACKGVKVIFHLAAGIEKTFPGCFMNSVVTTRNLLNSALSEGVIKRFVNVSSFAVYSNMNIKRGGMLDETCELESQFMERQDAYCFGKVKQDEIVLEYAKKFGLPYVIVRPGVVYGPGAKGAIHSRVGIGTFGIFLHLGGSNNLPLAYIDNCADAIVLAGITKGVDGEVFNIVDDNLVTSRRFLKLYKKNVKHFKSIFIPYRIFYMFCYLWERYSKWSVGQLPPAFNRRKCAAEWKGNQYSNKKLKDLLGWEPKLSADERLNRHYEYFKRMGVTHA